MEASSQTLLDGHYQVIFSGKMHMLAKAEDDTVAFLDDEGNVRNKVKVKTGVFKETDEIIHEKTGRKNFNILMFDPLIAESDSYGVISDDRKVVTVKGSHGMIFSMEMVGTAKAKELNDVLLSAKDPANAPPNHYTLRPGQAGKLIWITGPPGSGKSTTARRMMEIEGFVYYEGDCFMSNKNPYLPPADNTAIDALIEARPLRGIPSKRKEVLGQAMKEWSKFKNGEDYDMEDFYTLLCENIVKERQRVGGDWVVAQAVPTRKLRELVRSLLGQELVFVVLDLDEDLLKRRLKPRLGSYDMKYFDMKYEPAQLEEDNTVDLKITPEIELDIVISSILEKTK